MSLRTFGAAELRELDARAQASPRRRANLNLHDGDAALVHRFIISLRHDSYVRPHRHLPRHKLEMATLLDGAIDWLFFDHCGSVTQRVAVRHGGEICAIEVPPGHWHGVVATSPSAAFLEVKQGPYDAGADKEFALWAPGEHSAGAAAYLEWLRTAQVGQRYG